MCKLYVLLAGLCLSLGAMAQTDSTKHNGPDTIRVGGLIIIKRGDSYHSDRTVYINRRKSRNENVSTNWWIVDLGFANYNDKTNYSSAAAQQIAPGSTEDWFKLRNGKSVNVNIWVFMQRLNLIKHVVNLKYGAGIELNNYRFDDPIRYNKALNIFTMDAVNHYSKNKLAADYVTVPLMLNFNFTPRNINSKTFALSVGASGGYLYSSRQKTITSEEGKKKLHDDFELRQFKLSYIAELQLGPVKLYGSLASQSMFSKGLDQTPFTVGLRLSNW